jgi:hypothetical protein
MAWSISLLENSISFNESGVAAFNAFASENGLEEATENADGLYEVTFEPDHMEHMDFVWKEEFLDTMKIGKANGRALFGSLEGDNSGEFWGYSFEDGKMVKLVGSSIEWDWEKPKRRKRTA